MEVLLPGSRTADVGNEATGGASERVIWEAMMIDESNLFTDHGRMSSSRLLVFVGVGVGGVDTPRSSASIHVHSIVPGWSSGHGRATVSARLENLPVTV